MKNIFVSFLLLFTALATQHAYADFGWAGSKFVQTTYYSGASGLGSHTGRDAGNAKAIVDGDLFAIPANTVIENVYVIIDTAITGTSALNVGDDDDNDGYVPTASVTLGTPGMYAWDAKNGGAYKRIQTAGATDAADIYVVPNAKFYSAAGKEVKLDVTGTNTAGAFRVVVEGYRLK